MLKNPSVLQLVRQSEKNGNSTIKVKKKKEEIIENQLVQIMKIMLNNLMIYNK